jgi:hypothetical protein
MSAIKILCPSCREREVPRPEAICSHCLSPVTGLLRCHAATQHGTRCSKWALPNQGFCVVHARQGYMLFTSALVARLRMNIACNRIPLLVARARAAGVVVKEPADLVPFMDVEERGTSNKAPGSRGSI